MPLNVAVRVDASSIIGSGHVIRCLTLAEYLRRSDTTTYFICREHDGHLCGLIEARGFSVKRLPATDAMFRFQEDAEQTRIALASLGANVDWLVIDHYAIDAAWERALRVPGRSLLVIDDMANRTHDCDLLLDQNQVAQMHARYAGKVPVACGMLLGPWYALLQPAYAELHRSVRPRSGPIRRIFIFFGGADRDNFTACALGALLQLQRPDVEVDVVISEGSPHAEGIRRQAAGRSNIHLHSALPTLAPLMAKADLAIGASGATNWERLCLGLPALVVSLAENQRPLADELSKRGLVRWIGHRDAVDESTITQQLGALLQQGLDVNWSLQCLAAVDGKGTARVCAVITVTASTSLRVRRARPEDEALLLEWANDPVTRANAFDATPIPAVTHKAWYCARLGNLEGCRLYLVETEDGVQLGQVRFERSGEAWEVHYALAPVFRGRGLGRPLLGAAMREFGIDARGARIFGRVKGGNLPSCKVFESLGFEKTPNAQNGAVYRRNL